MAVKKKANSKKKATPRTSTNSVRDKIVQSALKISSSDGWKAVSPARISSDTSIPLGQAIALGPSRAGIAALVLKHVNERVLSQVHAVDMTDTAKDRLFEVMMMRFDVLQIHRDGIAALIRYGQRRPGEFICLAPNVLHSMALMLSAAGLGAGGLLGVVRAKALAVAYTSTLRVWLKDESGDMAQTMSALDKALRQLERLAQMTVKRPRKRKAGSSKGKN